MDDSIDGRNDSRYDNVDADSDSASITLDQDLMVGDNDNDNIEHREENASVARDDHTASVQEEDDASLSDDSDSSNEDDNDSHNGGLSELEKRRLERIQRNKEVLSRLGLADLKLGTESKQPRKRDKKRDVDPVDVRKSSRRSNKDVNYTDQPVKPVKLVKKERPKETRMERFIFNEFQRLQSLHKNELKIAEKLFRSAQQEHRSAVRKADAITRQYQRREEVEKMGATWESEKRKFGKSLREFLQEVDHRQYELHSELCDFNCLNMTPERLAYVEKQRWEQERKMEMIDAINGFPNALKEAVNYLNILLVERVPKEAPPRLSDRKRRALKMEVVEEPRDTNLISPENDGKMAAGECLKLAAAVATHQPCKIDDCALNDDNDVDGQPKQANNDARKIDPKMKNRNVGGWVSPSFASQIERSWLEGEIYESKLNLSKYIPQIGDIVLYYPRGHQDFLKQHPDELGKKLKNITRMPLWERARKERRKYNGVDAKSIDKDLSVQDEERKTENTSRKQSIWWNDEWLADVDNDLRTYPLICRVERTHAEFPPELDAEIQVVTERGVQKIYFKDSKPKKRKSTPKVPLHLAVTLKPLTPLVPPVWNIETRKLLSLPPVFQVTTFPSRCSPFIIPFGYGYSMSHAISVGNNVTFRNEPRTRGVVASFLSIERYGSGRLDNCATRIASLLALFRNEGSARFASSLELSLALAHGGVKHTLPLADAGVVINTMAARIENYMYASETFRRSDLSGSLIDLVMMTLPLWNGVFVMAQNRNAIFASPWDLESTEVTFNRLPDAAYKSLTDQVLADNGLLYHIDETLRTKLECALEDFVAKDEDAYIFSDPVTDDIAPSYGCAVPKGSCFSHVLRRLSRGKPGRDERKHPYYRTADSVLSDIASILSNCMLYNSPDSEVVRQGFRVIAESKMLVEQVVTQHQKERAAREKAEQERKKKIMSQFSASPCIHPNQSIAISGNKASKSRRSSLSTAGQTAQGPFTEPLFRDWMEHSGRDASWAGCVDTVESSEKGFTKWIPQGGDMILYSRFLHSEFIKGHEESLLTDQCSIPQFVVGALASQSVGVIDNMDAHLPPKAYVMENQLDIFQQDFTVADQQATVFEVARTTDGSVWGELGILEDYEPLHVFDPICPNVDPMLRPGTVGPIEGAGRTDTERPSQLDAGAALSHEIHSQWLVGKISWVRRVFPRHPSKKGKEFDTFSILSPLLCIGIAFDYEWTNGEQIHVVYWRPCVVSPPSGGLEKQCQSCGCHSDFGFLLPAWLYQSSVVDSALQRPVLLPRKTTIDLDSVFLQPVGLDRDSIAAVNQCFNVLKRRCLGGIPPDYVPKTLSVANVKKGWNPPCMAGSKALPTFEYLFRNNVILDADRTSNRSTAQPRKLDLPDELEKSVTLLAKIHFIPPYSKPPFKFTLKSNDTASNKQQRISLEESLCPSPKLSLELIQQRLRNGYYRQRYGLIDDIQEAYVASVLLVLSIRSSKFGTTFSPKKIAKALLKSSAVGKRGSKKSENDLTANTGSQMSKDEDAIVGMIKRVRSLYAMALVSVSETRFVDCIFGTSPKRMVNSEVLPEPTEQQKRAAIANEKLSLLLTAISCDPRMYRSSRALKGANTVGQDGNMYPSVTVKITGRLKLTKQELPPIVFSPADYFNRENLIRYFFGMPSRMDACARCQVARHSMLLCRVQRGHLNPDFGWDDVCAGVGGIDGLLFTLRTGEPVLPFPTELLPASPDTTDGPTNVEAPQLSEVLQDKDAGRGDQDSQSKLHEAVQLAAKASRALNLAENLLQSARRVAALPTQLSDDFIRNSFPIDPEDGHFTYCSICGLSGDVMCCEKCPVVMHPLCAGSEEVPEGDWFCPSCSSVGAAPSTGCLEIESQNFPLYEEKDQSCDLGDHGREKSLDDNAPTDQPPSESNEQKRIQNNDNEMNSGASSRSELETLLTTLRDARHACSNAKPRKKEDQDAANRDKQQEDALSDARDTTTDAEPVTNADVDATGGISTTQRSLESISVISERLCDVQPPGPLPVGIGSKVSKDFGTFGRFLGVVKSLPNAEYPFYNIRYEDGDEEDMDEAELRDVLISIKPPSNGQENLETQDNLRKRGRPSLDMNISERSRHSVRSSAPVREQLLSSQLDGFKVEFKPGVRVVPKKRMYTGRTATIIRSVGRQTWEVRFDDARKLETFSSQQLSFVDSARKMDDVTDEPKHNAHRSPAASVMRLARGVRVFPIKRKWRDKIGTIVEAVAPYIWRVKFDDGVNRGMFKSLQLRFANETPLTEVGHTAKVNVSVGKENDVGEKVVNTDPAAPFKRGRGRPRKIAPLVTTAERESLSGGRSLAATPERVSQRNGKSPIRNLSVLVETRQFPKRERESDVMTDVAEKDGATLERLSKRRRTEKSIS